MDGLVVRDIRVALVIQEGQDFQALLGVLASKDFQVQEDIWGMLEMRYTLKLIHCIYSSENISNTLYKRQLIVAAA